MKNPAHPALVMSLFSSFIFLIYFIGPISLTPKISAEGTLFLLAHIALFISGTALASIVITNKIYSVAGRELRERRLTRLLLLIGVCGGLISLYLNVRELPHVDLASIATLRAFKAQNLLHGGKSHGGYLSALAFLIYPAGFAGLVAGLLQYERIGRVTRVFLYLFVAILFSVAILAGGRSPILLLILFIAISCYTRTKLGKSWMPNSRFLRIAAAALLMAFIAYSSIMWSVRAAESNRSTEQALQYAADIGGASPKPWLVATSASLNRPGFTLTVLNSVFYLTQNLQVTEKIWANRDDIPALYGSYHIDMIAAALRLLPSGANFLKERYATLMRVKIYGYFTGAWGALFIDYGYFSLLAALIWGLLAGMAWVNFKNQPCVMTGMLYVFWSYSILIGFASPPFGFSNSFMVFAWFMLFYACSFLLREEKSIRI